MFNIADVSLLNLTDVESKLSSALLNSAQRGVLRDLNFQANNSDRRLNATPDSKSMKVYDILLYIYVLLAYCSPWSHRFLNA